MYAPRGQDARLMTDGYERSLTIEGRGTFVFKAGEAKVVRTPKGNIQTGRIGFPDGHQLWAIFVDTSDGFDVHCFVPYQVGNDLEPFDFVRGLCGKPTWKAEDCRYRLDGKPVHERSAYDVDPTGWSKRTLAGAARPNGLVPTTVDVEALIRMIGAGLGSAPEDVREMAARLRTASKALADQAALID